MNHPVRQPNTRPPAIVDPTDAFAVGQQLADLTTAQQAELQALITRAVAIATTQHLDRRTPHAAGGRGERSPLAEPGVWIVLVMLALVAVVAIVALAAVVGLAAIGA